MNTTLWIATVMLIVAALLLGLAIGLWHTQRGDRNGAAAAAPDPDADVQQDIDRAALEWATAHDRPELAALLAEKVRLAWSLTYGRGRPDGMG